MSAAPKKVGVVIGRFQVPSPHLGHVSLLYKAMDESDSLIVMVGCSDITPNAHDPLDFRTRRGMLDTLFKSCQYNLPEKKQWAVVELKDRFSDAEWVRSVDNLIEQNIIGDSDVTLYFGRDGSAGIYKNHGGKFGVLYLGEVSGFSGTQARAEAADRYAVDTIRPDYAEAFRRGVIYGATNRYPIICPTVDIMMYSATRGFVFCKKPGQDLWRLPGGFVDKDEELEVAAVREAVEETGVAPLDPEFLFSAVVKDPRTSASDCNVSILTSVFAGLVPAGAVLKAGDNIETAAFLGWIPPDAEIVPEHRGLVARIRKHLLKESP